MTPLQPHGKFPFVWHIAQTWVLQIKVKTASFVPQEPQLYQLYRLCMLASSLLPPREGHSGDRSSRLYCLTMQK